MKLRLCIIKELVLMGNVTEAMKHLIDASDFLHAQLDLHYMSSTQDTKHVVKLPGFDTPNTMCEFLSW